MRVMMGLIKLLERAVSWCHEASDRKIGRLVERMTPDQRRRYDEMTAGMRSTLLRYKREEAKAKAVPENSMACQDFPPIKDVPSIEEWKAIDAAMGEHMVPTGWMRFTGSCNQYPRLEREWRGSLGTIWGIVPGIYTDGT